MKLYAIASSLISIVLLTACLDTNDNSTAESTAVSEEEMKLRQQKVFSEASETPRQFRENLKENCPHFNSILLITAETIQLGTRVFNAGGVSLTNRIYEGTVYKILFTIKDECTDLSDALQAGLAMAQEKDSYQDKAWALRNTLDLIMGGSPLKQPGA